MWDQFLYGVCYYPEHWDESRRASDIARIAACGFQFIRMGEGAWNYWEPREGVFQFELFDRVIDLCRQHGLKVILGTPTYCAPAWVSTSYPEVLRWDFRRLPMAHGSRRNLNYTSPKYLDLSDRICTALADHYRNEPQVIAWQLDNEFNCHMDVSYAPSDTVAFRRWLKEKYETLDRLNDAWGTRFWAQTYDDWEQIDLPHPTATCLNPSVLLDETRFISDCVVRFARRQADILRRSNPRWRITHNGLFANVNGPELVKTLDFFSHDQYPLFQGEWVGAAAPLIQARSLSFPYAILEQQSGPGGQMSYLQRTPRPGEMRLWTWQSIAHGAKMLSYFRWRTCPYGSEQHWHGLLDADDRDNRRIVEATKVAGELQQVPAAFLDARPEMCVAVLRDFDNETNERRINTYIGKGAGEWWHWVAEMSRRHVPVDIVWPAGNFSGYQVIIAPHLKILTGELAEKLTAFVDAGGTLVLGAQSGSKDYNNHIVEAPLPGLLSALAGIEIEDWTMLGDGQVRQATLGDSRTIELHAFVERIRPTGAQPLARWGSDDPLLADAPAITLNASGRGRVYYVGGYLPASGIATLCEYLIEAASLEAVVDAPPEVEALRRTSEDREFLVLLNHSGSSQPVRELPTGRDLFSEAELGPSVYLLPPYEVALIEIERGKSR